MAKSNNISGMGILGVLIGIGFGFVGFASGFFPLGILGIVIFVIGAAQRQKTPSKPCPFCRSEIDPLAVICPRCQKEQPGAAPVR